MTPAEKKEFEALKATVAELTSKVKACVSTDLAQNRYLATLNDRTAPKYNNIKQCPDWARMTVAKLQKNGYLNGVNDNGDLALTDDLTRTLVIVDRAGGFD